MEPSEPQALESPMPEEALAGDPAEELVPVAGLGFTAGDFVWGKEREGGLWWPGRVQDPSAPPENAKPPPPAAEGVAPVLVSFFGGVRKPLAWCHPSQLVPFEEDFARTAKRSSSGRSFVAALRSALEEMERCLILEMACSCAEIGDPAEGKKESSGGDRRSGTNYSPAELLELISVVAGDVLASDMLEVTMLRSWVIAFAHGGGRLRRGIAELVDKIDLDAPPVEWTEEEDDAAAGAEVKKEKLHGRRPYPRAKRKSVAKIIAEMDLNAMDDDGAEEESKDSCADDAKEAAARDDKSSGFDEGNIDGSQEEALSGKRERKKSKYLSFPYTDSSGHGRQAASSGGDLEIKAPDQASSPQEPLIGSPAMVRCNSSLNTEEKDLKSPGLKLDRISMYEIQSELLAASIDVVNLKRYRLAKLIKWFFAMYRSSSYSDGVDFEAHQKHQAESGCLGMTNSAFGFWDARLKEKETSSRRKKRMSGASGEIQSDSGRKKRVRKEKAAEENQDASCLVQDMVDGSETSKVSSAKRKSKKPAASGQSSGGSTAIHTSETVVVGPDMETKDVAAATISMPSPCNGAIESSEKIKTATTKKGKNTKAPTPSDPGSSANGITNGPKKRTRKDGSNAQTARKKAELGDNNGSTTGKVKRSRKNTVEAAQTNTVGFELNGYPGSSEQTMVKGNELSIWEKAIVAGNQVPNGAAGGKPAAVLLVTFAPGVALPSKDDLCSEFAKYGDLVLDETELQEDARCAAVVFASSAHAERALACAEKSGVFAPLNATYRIDHHNRAGSPVPKPPLSYIRKNLERMITTLAGSSPTENNNAGGGDGDGKENLVGEMQGLLEKVNKMLSCTPS